jgi:hypothetical protein
LLKNLELSGREDMSDHELSAAQQKAIGAILAGKSITEAAIAAEVNRTTLHRWLNDAHFDCVLSRSRRELREAMRARLLALGDKAIDAVEQSIAEGDANAALAVLKGLAWFSRAWDKG